MFLKVSLFAIICAVCLAIPMESTLDTDHPKSRNADLLNTFYQDTVQQFLNTFPLMIRKMPTLDVKGLMKDVSNFLSEYNTSELMKDLGIKNVHLDF